MDLATFKSQLEASRQFTATVDGATFRLTLPSDHAWRVVLEANRDADGRIQEAKGYRALLDLAVVGWDGVTTRHVLPEADPVEPLPFSDESRAMLLDTRQDIADGLFVECGLKMMERRKKREAAAKN